MFKRFNLSAVQTIAVYIVEVYLAYYMNQIASMWLCLNCIGLPLECGVRTTGTTSQGRTFSPFIIQTQINRCNKSWNVQTDRVGLVYELGTILS